MNKKVALMCLILYSCVAAWSAINPIDKTTRLIEFLTSAIPVLILVVLYIKKIRFSSLGYILMTILPVMHVIGAHYTFANVPSQWLSDLLGTSRNMYDRIAHVSVGFYAFGLIEFIDMKKLTRSWGLKLSYALFAIMALAAAYELFERRYAIISDPEAGMAILGSQGDIRDAQKDILMDTIGALFAIILYSISRWKK